MGNNRQPRISINLEKDLSEKQMRVYNKGWSQTKKTDKATADWDTWEKETGLSTLQLFKGSWR